MIHQTEERRETGNLAETRVIRREQGGLQSSSFSNCDTRLREYCALQTQRELKLIIMSHCVVIYVFEIVLNRSGDIVGDCDLKKRWQCDNACSSMTSDGSHEHTSMKSERL